MIGAKNEKIEIENTESRMLISQHTGEVRCQVSVAQVQVQTKLKAKV